MKIKALSLLIAICMVVCLFPAAGAAGIEDYPALEYGVELTLVCSNEEVTYVTFTPVASGTYRFYSEGDRDTIAQLYDAQMSQIAYSDDCHDEAEHGHSAGINFCIIKELEAGATYVLGVRFYDYATDEIVIGVGCGHTYVDEVIKVATCAEDGSIRHTCSVCGYSYTETIYRNEHTYTAAVTKEPNCTEKGAWTYTCSECGYSYTEDIRALGHKCDEDLRCIRCGVMHPTSGVWSDEDGRSLSWVFADGMLVLTGEGEMPHNPYDYDMWGDPEYFTDTPWMALPVTELVVGSGITSVSDSAFANSEKLEKITLPGTVKWIGTEAFLNCTALTSVVLPEGLSSIHTDAFWGCGLREVSIPASLEYNLYLKDVFGDNENLERVAVAAGNPHYSSDSQGVLYSKDMTSLELFPYGYKGTYTLPASVERLWGDLCTAPALETIEVEAGSASYFSEDGILYWYGMGEIYDENEGWVDFYMDKKMIACPPAKELGSYVIGADVDALDYNAMNGCRFLTELTIPATCHVYYFTGLVRGCTALEAVWFEEGHPEFASDAQGVVFNSKDDYSGMSLNSYGPGGILEYVPAARTGYYAIPEGVGFVRGNAFQDTQLSAVRFPASLLELGGSVFMGPENLNWILFAGDHPFTVDMMDGEWCMGVTATLYYPGWMEQWVADPRLNEWGCDITYIPYDQGQEPVWGEEPEKPENPFTDVAAGSFYAEPVAWAVEKGITNGSDATHFNPFGVCNRAQVVTFLHRAKGSPAPASMDLPFTDVPGGSFYAAPVAWAVEKGITNGLSATAFGPNTACNRAQVVTFLYRAYH